MKKRKNLPLGGTKLRAWPDQNFLIELLKNSDTGYDWLMSTFIQIRGSHYQRYDWEEQDTRITFYPYSMHQMSPNIFDLCPFIDKYNIPKSFVLDKYDHFISFVREAIDENYYISTIIDQFFRKDMLGYLGFHHPVYLFGYDDFNQQVYLLDNFERGKYRIKTILYEQLEYAFKMVQEDNWNVSVFLYRLKDYQYQFESQFVREQIQDYLEPQKGVCYLHRTIYQNDRYKDEHYSDDVYFGLECYELLENYLYSLSIGDALYSDFDWRSFVMLCDHKLLMKERYQFMCEKKYMKEEGNLLELIETLIKECTITQNIFLKYTISNDLKCITRMQERIKSIKKLDEQMMKQFVEVIN